MAAETTGIDKAGSEKATQESLDYAPAQEMRLAVVMYGGISLAIYMNGVAQEFLNLVRSTAPEKDADGIPTGRLLWSEERLGGTARVYRKLGRMLDGITPATNFVEAGPVRTRFVVDIVTGTSAGGINGVFLAKALANQQEMDGLTRMWREEGDLPKLLNDGARPSVLAGKSPDALLNSRRILELFNDAMKGMTWDEGSARRPNWLACESPYVEELDLFVTTTDMTGLLLPIRLEDRVIYERRSKNYFHFRYGYPAENGELYNSFQPLNSTFLAFAARCTSAFPFAFAPMNLETAESICGKPGLADWTGFFADYQNAARSMAGSHGVRRDDGISFAQRSFVDGGCLDNKPFSYAIDALRWKQSDLPVTRKLFYLEPAPAHPESGGAGVPHPDALDSVFAGYVDLPRVENIREDLQRLLDRNRLIGRIKDALQAVSPTAEESDTQAWERTTIKDLRDSGGPAASAYAAYHRMKVSAVTDSLALVVVCAAGLDAGSDDALAIRYLVKAWRNATYPDIMDPRHAHPEAGRKGNTSSKFLLDFDFDYRIRRLSFVRRAINAYYQRYWRENDAQRRALLLAKRRINAVRRGLLRTDSLARSHDPASGNPLQPLIANLAAALPGSTPAAGSAAAFSGLVQEILRRDSDAERLAFAAGVYAQMAQPVEALAKGVADLYARPPQQDSQDAIAVERLGFFEASELASTALKEVSLSVAPFGGTPSIIDTYYGYESCDAAMFPILYGTDVGEVKEVEVVRISPDDAAPLCPRPRGTAKLAGDSLGHFGAFLEQSWREHDILWGRLDGVDRIINGLAPSMDEPLKAQLIREGQIAVLEEWRNQIGGSLSGETLYALLKDPNSPIPPEASATASDWRLTPERFVLAARQGAVNGLPRMTSGESLGLAGRALAVMSSMNHGMAARRTAPWARTPLSLSGGLLGSLSTLLRLGVWPWVAVVVIAIAIVFASLAFHVPGILGIGVAIGAAGILGCAAREWLAARVKALLGSN